ncbi:MAG: glycoside hydrolase family protein [Prevotella sp.]|nr:glycoside hydrolase family protein [Prevotella sp.]
MKKFLTFVLLIFIVGGINAKSDKRGVSENQFSMGSMLEALAPGVTWYYNWGNTPGKGYQNEVINNDDLEFVPMCWNANYNAEAIREYCKTHPKTKYLLGFNEPNFTKQADMTPQEAALAWPAVKALADELNLKLVAPALNYSPNPPYTDPLKWMDEFVALVGLDAFDYTAIHNYGGLGVMKTLAGNFHDRYGKDVWVTEFCLWPNEGDANSYVAPASQIASMVETVGWLESTPWIFRYAWFKALGNYDASKGPNYGLLRHEGVNTDPWVLTDQGKVYVGLAAYDPALCHQINTSIPVGNYLNSSLLQLGTTADTENISGVEITRFVSGASADYRFEVPADGSYTLHLRVSGFGAPSRFDPSISLHEVDTDGKVLCTLHPAYSFTLPNSDDIYTDVVFPIELAKGKRIIRIQDANTYMPSGIRISTICLNDASDVEMIEVLPGNTTADVYSLTGICLKKGEEVSKALEGLPEGIYIVGGRKIRK